MNVKDILAGSQVQCATVQADAKLTEAARKLSQAGTNLLVVRDFDGRLVGVVSKADIVSRISHCSGCRCTEAVSTAMTTDVVQTVPHEDARTVWERMRTAGVPNVPVVDRQDRPIAILSAKDVLQAILGEVEYEEALLRDYIVGLGYR